MGKFFFIQYLYKNREREKIVEEEKKVVVFKKKKERQKTIYRVKWPPFLSKQAKEDPRES